ncbi:MAG: hypothetical protein P4L99_14660 [Chthoniobacter sp.]|nr:hypothetical protein [Chthoniobacter sp.]
MKFSLRMRRLALLRGDASKVYDRYWTALGVARFARAGCDSRLGPSDGERDATTGSGVTFAPTWREDGHWVRMADVPDRYRGKFSVQFAHPLLVRSTYGWLLPVRAPADDGLNQTFVYPHNTGDPAAESVRKSLRIGNDGFESNLGSVHGTLYVGRTSAGGEGEAIDLDDDGKPEVTFDAQCRFVVQLRDRKVVAIEADRKVTAHVGDRTAPLEAYRPVSL